MEKEDRIGKNNKPLDDLDLSILREIQVNAKLSNKEIGEKVGLTATPVFERIKRLERTGIISSIVAMVDRKAVGKKLVAFCCISLKEHHKQYLETFEQEIIRFKEVTECYHIAGDYDFMLKVVVQDMEAYHKFVIGQLAAMENVGNAMSWFVMNEIKYSTAVPI